MREPHLVIKLDLVRLKLLPRTLWSGSTSSLETAAIPGSWVLFQAPKPWMGEFPATNTASLQPCPSCSSTVLFDFGLCVPRRAGGLEQRSSPFGCGAGTSLWCWNQPREPVKPSMLIDSDSSCCCPACHYWHCARDWRQSEGQSHPTGLLSSLSCPCSANLGDRLRSCQEQPSQISILGSPPRAASTLYLKVVCPIFPLPQQGAQVPLQAGGGTSCWNVW